MTYGVLRWRDNMILYAHVSIISALCLWILKSISDWLNCARKCVAILERDKITTEAVNESWKKRKLIEQITKGISQFISDKWRLNHNMY